MNAETGTWISLKIEEPREQDCPFLITNFGGYSNIIYGVFKDRPDNFKFDYGEATHWLRLPKTPENPNGGKGSSIPHHALHFYIIPTNSGFEATGIINVKRKVSSLSENEAKYRLRVAMAEWMRCETNQIDFISEDGFSSNLS